MSSPTRFIGLDLHKHYLVATGVDDDLNKVYGPRRVELSRLQEWIQKALSTDDSVVLEMTTNTWQVHDELLPYVHSVTVVHPPHVALITRARVMTDRIAANHLARLHAKGLLAGIWIPPQETRDLRTLVQQRQKMIRLKTQAKCRLHAVLHRYHILPPQNLFHPNLSTWWIDLPLSTLEKVCIQSDLDTLTFSLDQIKNLDKSLASWASQEKQILFLLQLSGVALITATTLLAAIGDIHRFPSPKHLVSYAGLGVCVHNSGLSKRSGGITKAGRKEMRTVLVEAARTAAQRDPRWSDEFDRLAPRIGKHKAVVAVARKMLVVIWHVLTKEIADYQADIQKLARKYMEFAYLIGKENRQGTAAEYVRRQLDRLGVGQDLPYIISGKQHIPLPPSSLTSM